MKKRTDRQKTTEQLLSLGMALQADRTTMEQRIRGIFSRKSGWSSVAGALLLAAVLTAGCFTTACRPVSGQGTEDPAGRVQQTGENQPEADEAAVPAAQDEAAPLFTFPGRATAEIIGSDIVVTSAVGTRNTFHVNDRGTKEWSDPLPEQSYASPMEAAKAAAETAVTVFGDIDGECDLEVSIYYNADSAELVYYEVLFGSSGQDRGFAYLDAATGELLTVDANAWGRAGEKYGNDFMNAKIAGYDWEEDYEEHQTSRKALATAMELIRTDFPTGTIIPYDPEDWEGGSHTDGEQISWDGGYQAIVDTYIRMDAGPCYYVQIAVPLEEGAAAYPTIFGRYPLGWEYCTNQIHDPKVLEQELSELAELRANYAREQEMRPMRVELARAMIGRDARFPGEQPGDGVSEYSKAYLLQKMNYHPADDGGHSFSERSEQEFSLNPEFVAGNYLLLAKSREDMEAGEGLYAVGIEDLRCVYADPETGKVVEAVIPDLMQEQGYLILEYLESRLPEADPGSGEAPVPTPTPAPVP